MVTMYNFWMHYAATGGFNPWELNLAERNGATGPDTVCPFIRGWGPGNPDPRPHPAGRSGTCVSVSISSATGFHPILIP